MPDSNSYEMMIKFVMDNQGAEKALKTMTDFNNSVKNLTIGLDELDKKGLSTFDKLINTLTSSRTGNAVQQLNSLSAALRSLGITAAQISGVSTIGGAFATQAVGSPEFLKQYAQGPSGFFEPVLSKTQPRSTSVDEGIQYTGGIIDTDAYGGGGGGRGFGGMQRGFPVGTGGGLFDRIFQLKAANEELKELFGLQKMDSTYGVPSQRKTIGDIRKSDGTFAALGVLSRAASPYLLAAMAGGLAIQKTSDAINYFQTIESVSQAAVQTAERSPLQQAISGDITLEFLKQKGIGFGFERGQALERYRSGQAGLFEGYGTNLQAAMQTKGILSLATLQALLNLRTKDGALDLALAEYTMQGQQLDLSRYGDTTRFASSAMSELYGPFSRTYQLYGREGTEAMLSRFTGTVNAQGVRSANARTKQEVLEAQEFAKRSGLGLGDVSSENMAFLRRFGVAPSIQQLSYMFGGTSDVAVRNTIFGGIQTLMGGGRKIGDPSTEIFSELVADRLPGFLPYGNDIRKDYSQMIAPLTAAASYMSGDMTQAQRKEQQKMLAKYFESQTQPGSMGETAAIRALIGAGVTNIGEAEYVLKMFRAGKQSEAMDFLKRIGVKATKADLRKATAEYTTEMEASALAVFPHAGAMEVSPFTLTKVKGGVTPEAEGMAVARTIFSEDVKTVQTPPERRRDEATDIDLEKFAYVMKGAQAGNAAVLKILTSSYRSLSEKLQTQLDEINNKYPDSNFNGSKKQDKLPPGRR